MRQRRPLDHPLKPFFERSAESLTTALGDASVKGYHATSGASCII